MDNNSSPITYLPGQNWDKFYIPTFHQYMRCMIAQAENKEELLPSILNVGSLDEAIQVLNYCVKERWSYSASEDLYEGLSESEISELESGGESVNFLYDFDAYFPDFIKFYGIDLLRDEVSIAEFLFLFQAVCGYDGAMSSRIQIRNYKPKAGEDASHKHSMLAQRSRYALSEDYNYNLEEITHLIGEE